MPIASKRRSVSKTQSRTGRSTGAVARTTARKSTVSAKRGFAAMSAAKRKSIAAKGGRARKSA